MRRSIDRHPERWRAVLGDETFRRVFFPQLKKTAGGAEAVVKAFVGKNQMNALKKKPMVSFFFYTVAGDFFGGLVC